MKNNCAFKKKVLFPSLRGAEGKAAQLLKGLTSFKGFSNLPKSLVRDLKLVLAEGVANAFQHGECSRKKPAKVSLIATPKEIKIEIEDWGRGFDQNSKLRTPPTGLGTEGRGLWIIKGLVDKLTYKKGRPNRLILVRKLTRSRSLDSALELFDLLQDSIQRLRPIQVLYDQFIDFIVDLFNVERASFLIFDPKRKALRVATSRGIPSNVTKKILIPPGEGIAGNVFQTSRPLLVNNLAQMKKEGPQPRKKGYSTKSFVSVPVIASPLHIGEETLGVLNLTDKRDGTRFTSKDLQLLSLMASQAASAFRIRDLIDAIKKSEGINRELKIVREIQERLIPERFPKFSGAQLGGHCHLSQRGGGDYYDVLKVNRFLRGVVADVSGHNVGSAITMASFRSIFRSLVFDPNTPGGLLRALRWAMFEELIKLHQFISCWVFEYEPNGNLTVSGAGHPPIMILNKKSGKWSNVFSGHLPLGLEDESRVQNTKIKLHKEDLVFFYTDGLFDPRMRATGFDRQRVTDLVERSNHLTPKKIVEKVFEELSPHHMLLRSKDDVAILALRRK